MFPVQAVIFLIQNFYWTIPLEISGILLALFSYEFPMA